MRSYTFRALLILLFSALWLTSLAAAPDAAGSPSPAPHATPLNWKVPPLFSEEHLFDAAQRLTALVDGWSERFASQRLNENTGLGVSITRLCFSLALFALVAAAAATLLRFIRRRAEPLDSERPQNGLNLALAAARLPLALLIWDYGLYFSLVLLLSQAGVPVEAFHGLGIAAAVVRTGALFWLLFRLITAVEKRLSQTTNGLLAALVPFAGTALRVLLPLLAAILMVPLLALDPASDRLVKTLLAMALIGSLGYILIALISAVEKALLHSFNLQAEDNLTARKIYTQVSVLKRITGTAIFVLTVGCMLMLFEPVRQLGASILASAGIAGVVLGFAAQKTLGNLIAGIQIALTQPIRIDDVVIVEGEWGKIEEITLTYVVVQIWDLRRLVVPITYFVEKPFQNWTRDSSRLLGTVMLYVDFCAPIEAIRTELTRIVAAHPLWDKQVCVLQVTDATHGDIELRALVSAVDAPRAFDLRCAVREQLLSFLREHHPEAFPRVRNELGGGRNDQ